MAKRIKSKAQWWDTADTQKIPVKSSGVSSALNPVPNIRGGYGSLRNRGIRIPHLGDNYLEWLQRQSEFGGTSLEQQVDGAAKQLGQHFDDAQVDIQIGLTGSYTLIDRVIWHPRKKAVYIDGWQHFARADHFYKDMLQTMDLEGNGWLVYHLAYFDIMANPLGTVARVFYG